MSSRSFSGLTNRYKNLLPDMSYISKISTQADLLSKYQDALYYSHLFPDDYVSIQAKHIEESGIFATANSLNLSSLPIPDNYLNQITIVSEQYSKIAQSLNLSFINEIQLTSRSIQETVDSLLPEFGNFFQYEDIYRKSYSELYSKIDNTHFRLQLDTDTPFQINVIDNANTLAYPLSNQKDVIGLTELFESITKEDALSFISFISNYPYLSSKHEIGTRILNELENIPSCIIDNISGVKLFRGRPWLDNQEMEYTISEMWQPPYGFPGIGRFNPFGISYLYMTDSLSTSIDEMKNQSRYSIMETVLEKEINVLDISKRNCYIFELCNKKKTGNLLNPKEYYLPCYIAQCCAFLEREKDIKIEGIKYKSSISENGYCYVFFNKYKDSFCDERIIPNVP